MLMGQSISMEVQRFPQMPTRLRLEQPLQQFLGRRLMGDALPTTRVLGPQMRLYPSA
ncbi:hypothetical protein IEO21_03285 [Rhodonia placenta]|uniref:Uncharacterized protein n=1 Tax=Rhodonia placenta TaxID=104341 RepID=A0A8H7U4D7_9APHY|nr:hypothetical protein IEO21_03285 [Postia placenta]